MKLPPAAERLCPSIAGRPGPADTAPVRGEPAIPAG
jgi:hypothetical protein